MDRKHPPEGPPAFEQEITLPAALDSLDQLLEWIETALRAYACPSRIIRQLMMVAEEIFVNIANYAYAGTSGEATVRAGKAGEALALQFEDAGTAFNPLDWPKPKLKGSIEERNIGGLGIYLVKTTTDHAAYQRLGEKNQLTIYKIPETD
jgi:sigma-B regulation protein RsbU (phosphoserine phosphatase)